MIRSREIQSFQDYRSSQWFRNFRHSDLAIELEEELDTALDRGEFLEERLGKPVSVLVVGCRTGYEVRAFQGLFHPAVIVGLDLVYDFLEYGVKAKGATQLVVGDMHRLPFADESFEWVYCVGTLEHAHDPARAAKEMKRVAPVVYVTADLDEDMPQDNTSHFSFSSDPEDWVALFEGGRDIDYWQEEGSVHILATR